jgi:hypothetical protein
MGVRPRSVLDVSANSIDPDEYTITQLNRMLAMMFMVKTVAVFLFLLLHASPGCAKHSSSSSQCIHRQPLAC